MRFTSARAEVARIRAIHGAKELGAVKLAACKDTSKHNSERACSCLSIVQLANGPKRSIGHVLGAEKIIFLIRDIDGPAMIAAAVESCQSVVLRSPWGRLVSKLYTCNRLHRIRGRFNHF